MDKLFYSLILTSFDVSDAGTAAYESGSSLYVVLSVTVILWIGIFFYLLHLDRKVSALKKRMEVKRAVPSDSA